VTKRPAENSAKTARVVGKPFPKGKSGNPGGRPKTTNSITHWMREFGNMTPKALADLCDLYAVKLRKGGDSTTMFGLIAVRLLMSQVDEPDSRLLDVLLDRTEGKVPDKLEIADWRKDALEAGIDPDTLASELFAKVKHDAP
jgi:hypothetical protein